MQTLQEQLISNLSSNRTESANERQSQFDYNIFALKIQKLNNYICHMFKFIS